MLSPTSQMLWIQKLRHRTGMCNLHHSISKKVPKTLAFYPRGSRCCFRGYNTYSDALTQHLGSFWKIKNTSFPMNLHFRWRLVGTASAQGTQRTVVKITWSPTHSCLKSWLPPQARILMEALLSLCKLPSGNIFRNGLDFSHPQPTYMLWAHACQQSYECIIDGVMLQCPKIRHFCSMNHFEKM